MVYELKNKNALIRNREDKGGLFSPHKTKLVPIYNPAYFLSRVYERRIHNLFFNHHIARAALDIVSRGLYQNVVFLFFFFLFSLLFQVFP